MVAAAGGRACDPRTARPGVPMLRGRESAGRTPIPPPLRQRFAVIEAQRAEEAALGERPLEEVMAPVPLPQVSA